MLEKLQRELQRLARSTFDPQAAVDHALNCALTADSMVDWVWQSHFRRMPHAQRQLVGKAMENQVSPPRDFRAALFERCEAVAICYDLARGTKHVFVERSPDPIVSRTNLVARTPEPFVLGVSGLGDGDVLAAEDGSIPSGPQSLPMVHLGETMRSAIQVFDQVILFWSDFLREFGIIDRAQDARDQTHAGDLPNHTKGA